MYRICINSDNQTRLGTFNDVERPIFIVDNKDR